VHDDDPDENVEYVPAKQAWQVAAPEFGLDNPAAQGWQVAGEVPTVALEAVPGKQSVHDVEARERVEYLPCPHAVQLIDAVAVGEV